MKKVVRRKSGQYKKYLLQPQSKVGRSTNHKRNFWKLEQEYKQIKKALHTISHEKLGEYNEEYNSKLTHYRIEDIINVIYQKDYPLRKYLCSRYGEN